MGMSYFVYLFISAWSSGCFHFSAMMKNPATNTHRTPNPDILILEPMCLSFTLDASLCRMETFRKCPARGLLGTYAPWNWSRPCLSYVTWPVITQWTWHLLVLCCYRITCSWPLFLLFNQKCCSLNKYPMWAFCVRGLPSSGEIDIN